MELLLKNLYREADIHMIGTMAYFGHSFSKTVVQTISLNNAKCFTIIPKTASEAHIYKFQTGGLYRQTQEKQVAVSVRDATTGVVAQIIHDFFSQSEKHCAIAEDMLSSPGDSHSHSQAKRYLSYNGEAYDFSCNSDDINEVVATLTRNDASYYSFFALLSLNTEQQVRFSQTKLDMNRNDINLLVSSLQGIIQYAYDGESYIIWDRNGTLLRLAEDAVQPDCGYARHYMIDS